MENESTFGRMFQGFSDKIQDQVWYQQGKAKWDERDARAKMAIKYASLIGGGALLIGLVGSSVYSVADQKHEIDEKLGLVQKIQSAQDELRRLREVTAQFNGAGDQPWGQFITAKAMPAGIDPSTLTIVSEIVIAANAAATTKDVRGKSKDPKDAAPPSSAGPEETVVEAGIKKINVRQLAKFLHEIENGGATVKVRKLQIDTHPDESGYLDATVVVSAFRLKQ